MVAAWALLQGIGAGAGMVALGIQAGVGWRRRRAPRDIDGLRQLLDTAYSHVLSIASRPVNGSPSLDLMENDAAVMAVIGMPRYAGRLKDPVLASAVREAGVKYHLAFALGTNLNRPHEERDRTLIDQQIRAATEALGSIRKAVDRLDQIERRLRP
ncbi:hypothetical protein ACFVHS_11100 [Streptomyces sp. NPDC057746]|uniref:hypothetical protein n=1 Tax=Streptomyces sp. NPDC057746 TaxID=3346237 RepID=UPI003674697F